MPIPDYQSCFLPLLRSIEDGNEYTMVAIRDQLISHFKLTDEERNRRLPSGKQRVINNRLGWAKTYMTRAGLIRAVRRGVFAITERGSNVLKQNPDKIDLHYLQQFPEFVEFRKLKHDDTEDKPSQEPAKDSEETPEEELENAHERLKADLAADLLALVKSSDPAFFEQLVVDLMLKMGYGGPDDGAGRVTQYGKDEGIDGIINEDSLGLDVIYLQAKRWGGTVGRPEIQKFVGALHGKRAKKGVFITTSTFSEDAETYVKTIDPKVVLIDGQKLSELMVSYNVGVSTAQTYSVKKVDSDYFGLE